MATSIERPVRVPETRSSSDTSIAEVSGASQHHRQSLAVRRLRVAMWVAAVILATSQFLAARHEVNPDGISYLDLAEQYASGEWRAAVSTYWSPLYPLLLGIVMRAVGPSPYSEATVAHAVNLVIVLGVIVAFEFFLRSLIDLRSAHRSREDVATVALAYALVLWGAFRLFGVGPVTPDGLLAIAVFVAAGLVCRIHRDGPTLSRFAGLGVALGLGYLAKAVMFPLAPAFIASGAIASRSMSKGMRGGLVALATFGLLAGPQVVAVSQRLDRLSFGESKSWTYAVVVNGMSNVAFWRGDVRDAGRPLAPPAILNDDPAVIGYEPTPGATYPFWYDAPRWLAGLDPPVHLAAQTGALIDHLRLYTELTLPIWMGVLALCFIAQLSRAEALRAARWHAILIAPAAAALALYALVHVEGRYVFAFLVIGALIAFDAARIVVAGPVPGFYRAVVLATSVALAAATVLHGSTLPAAVARQMARSPAASHRHWAAAEALRTLGVEEGAPVAYIGNSYYAYWARLAGVHIVAELPGDPSEVWANPATLHAVVAAFGRGGARHVVAERVPPWVSETEWIRLGATEYRLYRAATRDTQ